MVGGDGIEPPTSRCKRDALPAELTAPQAMRSSASVWEMQNIGHRKMADALEEDLVYGVFKSFPALNFGWFDALFELFHRSVDYALLSLCDAKQKRTEPYKPYFAFVLQRTGDIIENTINGTGSVDFRQPGIWATCPTRSFLFMATLLTRFIMLQH